LNCYYEASVVVQAAEAFCMQCTMMVNRRQRYNFFSTFSASICRKILCSDAE